MGKWTDTNFKSNLALVVSYHPIKFQIDQTKHLQVRDWKPKYFGCVQAQNGQTGQPQFCNKPSPGGVQVTLLSFNLIAQSVFRLETGNQIISDECMPKTGKRDRILLSYKLITQSTFQFESGNISDEGRPKMGKWRDHISKATKPWLCPSTC